MENRQRTRLASAFILALVFGAGLMVGLALDFSASASPAVESADATDAPEPDARDGRGERRPMYEQVGELSEEQRTAIDSVVMEFRDTGGAMREAHDREIEPLEERWRERFDSLVRATRAHIRAVMTEEQAQRYDSLIADYERRREEHREGRDSAGASRD